MSTYRTYPPGAFDKTEAAYYLGLGITKVNELQAQGKGRTAA